MNMTTNYFLIMIVACMISLVIETVVHFAQEPSEKKIANVKEFLLYVVVEAERIYKGGTGTVKLRYAYNLTVERFPWVGNIPFEVFSGWVDVTLEWLKVQLASNPDLKKYVEGE